MLSNQAAARLAYFVEAPLPGEAQKSPFHQQGLVVGADFGGLVQYRETFSNPHTVPIQAGQFHIGRHHLGSRLDQILQQLDLQVHISQTVKNSL